MRFLSPSFLISIAATLIAGVGSAQQCTSLITADEANVLHDPASITRAASGLIDQGADVHIITVERMAKYGPNLAAVENAYEHMCPSWNLTGRRKSNLFVLIVAPNDRQKNAFFGPGYAPAMQSSESVDALFSKAANPSFRAGDFSAGLAQALRDVSAKVAAYHDQQQHPVQATTIVNNQAHDSRGFYLFLDWLLGLSALGLVIWGIVAFLGYRRRNLETLATAKAEARAAQASGTAAFRALSRSSAYYETMAERFASLSNSVSYDPSADNLTAIEYNAIRDAWSTLAQDCRDAKQIDQPKTPSRAPNQSRPRTVSHRETSYPRQHPEPAVYRVDPNRTYSPPAPMPQPPAPVTNNGGNTVIVTDRSNSSNDLLTGMLVADALERPRYREPEPARETYRAPDPEPTSYSSVSDSSGSDSSWSSSDSGSSDTSSGNDSSW